MNTAIIILPNQRRFKSPSTREINPNTRNKCWNMPDKAADIFEAFVKRLRVSEGSFVRTSLAESIQRRDTWSGLAFRAAIGLRNLTKSIFTPNLTPPEAESIFEAEIKELKEAQATTLPTGGAKIVSEAISEFDGTGEFIPVQNGAAK